jgi:hypothetical protein
MKVEIDNAYGALDELDMEWYDKVGCFMGSERPSGQQRLRAWGMRRWSARLSGVVFE